MIVEVGHFALVLALLVAVFQMVVPAWGAHVRDRELMVPGLATLALLPIRDQVYFPHMIFPLLVGREKSVRALEDAIASQRHIMLVAQKRVDTEAPNHRGMLQKLAGMYGLGGYSEKAVATYDRLLALSPFNREFRQASGKSSFCRTIQPSVAAVDWA